MCSEQLLLDMYAVIFVCCIDNLVNKKERKKKRFSEAVN